MKTNKGLALEDIIRELHKQVLRIDAKTNEMAIIELLDRLASVEANLAAGTSERLQLGGMIAAFQLARNQLAAAPAQNV